MIARGVFEVAFRGLNQEEISEVLGFVKLKISNPKYQETCLYIMNHLLGTSNFEFRWVPTPGYWTISKN
jgi:hypothetical protein